jgi:hypothetical protein
MNWLSRFLHIKPASKTLCFRLGRGKVREDLVRLLRDWQRFGVRDVSFDRRTNVINARVDKSNRKYQYCSPLVFHAWRMEDYRFEVEIFYTEYMLPCNCAFSSLWLSLKFLLTDMILQISRSNRYTSPSSSLLSWSMVNAPSCASLGSRRRGAQHQVSAKSSMSSRTYAGLDAC